MAQFPGSSIVAVTPVLLALSLLVAAQHLHLAASHRISPAALNARINPESGPVLVDGCIHAGRKGSKNIAAIYGASYVAKMVEAGVMAAGPEVRGTVPIEDALWRGQFDPTDEVFEVPYSVSDSAYGSKVAGRIVAYLDELAAASGVIKFVGKTSTDSDWIRIRSEGQDSGCWSFVGRIGGKQTLNLEHPGCVNRPTVQHEALHALGFEHEQSRPDRDQHVNILFRNVQRGLKFNFEKVDKIDSLGSPYEIGSVMQYDGFAFTRNGRPTITDLDGEPVSSNEDQVSHTDVIQVRLLYQCESGPRNVSDYTSEPCTTDCKCGRFMRGCGSDSELCKGSLVCASNTCVVDGEEPQCSPGCPVSVLGNGVCDITCDVAACDFDGGDCTGGPVLDAPYEEFDDPKKEMKGLKNTVLQFSWDDASQSYTSCKFSSKKPPGPKGGKKLFLLDDDSLEVPFAHGPVSFFGKLYSSCWVGSNGIATMGSVISSSTYDISRHLEKPRIAGLFTDLQPELGGKIQMKQTTDGVAINFKAIRNWNAPKQTNTFQMFFNTQTNSVSLWYRGIKGRSPAIIGLSGGSPQADDAEPMVSANLEECS